MAPMTPDACPNAKTYPPVCSFRMVPGTSLDSTAACMRCQAYIPIRAVLNYYFGAVDDLKRKENRNAVLPT